MISAAWPTGIATTVSAHPNDAGAFEVRGYGRTSSKPKSDMVCLRVRPDFFWATVDPDRSHRKGYP